MAETERPCGARMREGLWVCTDPPNYLTNQKLEFSQKEDLDMSRKEIEIETSAKGGCGGGGEAL